MNKIGKNILILFTLFTVALIAIALAVFWNNSTSIKEDSNELLASNSNVPQESDNNARLLQDELLQLLDQKSHVLQCAEYNNRIAGHERVAMGYGYETYQGNYEAAEKEFISLQEKYFNLTQQNYPRPTVSTPPRDCATDDDTASFCLSEPSISDMGRETYPLNVKKYGETGLLGQLFTAHDCGSLRFARLLNKDNNYALGASMWLNGKPTIELQSVLQEIGFIKGSSCANISEKNCTHWHLWNVVPASEILKLKQFTSEIKFSECLICG